jgi:peptidoglycan/LPS O-acetylase OafA/YrhL
MISPAVRRHEPGLDLLRAGAALWILLWHAIFFVWHLRADWKMGLYAPSLGVDAFLVLGGFLVGRELLAGVGARAAIARRLWRVLPLYWLFLAINIALAGGMAPGEIIAHALLVHTLGDPAGPVMPESYVLATWAWFVLPAAVLLPIGARGPTAAARAAWLALAWIALGILVRCAWVLAQDPSWDEGTKKLVLPRLDAGAYGLLLAALLRARPRWFAVRSAGLGAGLALVAAATALHASRDVDHDLAARTVGFVLSGAGIALCVPALLGWRAPGGALGRGAAALARWSFLLYLVHFLPMRLLPADWPRAADWPAGLLHIAGYAALCILSAAALHRLMERPWVRLRPAPDRA